MPFVILSLFFLLQLRFLSVIRLVLFYNITYMWSAFILIIIIGALCVCVWVCGLSTSIGCCQLKWCSFRWCTIPTDESNLYDTAMQFLTRLICKHLNSPRNSIESVHIILSHRQNKPARVFCIANGHTTKKRKRAIEDESIVCAAIKKIPKSTHKTKQTCSFFGLHGRYFFSV